MRGETTEEFYSTKQLHHSKKIKAKRKKARQSGKGLAPNLVKVGLELGSKALSSEFGKKLINKGIDSIPNIWNFSEQSNLEPQK